jgi:hypothetical protein
MIAAVKALAVAWVAILCFLFSFVVSRTLDRVTPPLDRSKPTWRTFLEVVLQFGVIGIIAYFARLLIKKIPFGLDGVDGYVHSQLGELRSLPLLVFIFMFFQKRTQEKMKYLSESK